MKSSFVIASLAASAALATPLQKKWLVTAWDIQTVTQTVTGESPASTQEGRFFNWGGWGSHSSEAAPPAPTTTEVAAAPAPTPDAPAPEAPAPAPEAPAPEESTPEAAAPTGWGSSPAAPAAPAATQAISGDYAQGILDAHNNHRANASVPALTWSDNMASIAQQIAASCVYKHNTDAGGGGYGQNIGAGAPDKDIPGMITNQMYNGEINYYPLPYGKEPDMSNFEKWGHYSQIVWKSTTSVGCYTQHCPGGLANVGGNVSPYFTVCNYSPPGNFGGQYAANVLQPGGMPTVTL